MVTSDTRLRARQVIAEYEKRWWIEVLFKELRGPLGLSDYQVLSEQKIFKHLHLAGLAHQVLTHHGLSADGAQANTTTNPLPLPPLTQRLAHLRDTLRREQIQALEKRIRHAPLRRKVRKLLRELATAA